jgi:starvation-inducible DNA-binding protein
MKTNIGLSEETRKTVSDQLNKILAAEEVLYTKTRNYHWNVTGPQFYSLHLLFEQQYTALAEGIDEIAERIRSLGFNAVGTLAEFVKLSDLKDEEPGKYPDAGEMVARLVEGHEANIQTLRESIDWIDSDCKDQGTADFLTGKMEEHEKMAWMLRAFLNGEPVRN